MELFCGVRALSQSFIPLFRRCGTVVHRFDKTISLHLAEKTMTLQSPALDQIDAAAFHFAGSTLQMTYLVWDILDFKA